MLQIGHRSIALVKDRANIAHLPPQFLVLFFPSMLMYFDTARSFNLALKVLPLYQLRYIIIVFVVCLSSLPSILLL